jgi:tetratricopeptide (TPR) repeat protein
MVGASEDVTARPAERVIEGTAPTLVPDAASLDTLPSAERPRAGTPLSVPPGTLIDRFVVLHELGRGAMGVVLAALDPDLERRVAVKLLRDEGGGDSTGARQRLVQEARAMAQVSHPNVVGVYQVGTFEDRVYVAMELVKGRTLRAWLGDRPSVPRILEAFAAAGRGLATAHAAGIVHRDFKPDNVFVGDDDRVRVGDFGLAGRSARGTTRDGDPARSFTDFAITLTASGSIMGTPAYMSPEQFASSDVDARSDQFAFCVALFEALHGVRPFQADSLPELSARVTRGEMTLPPSPRGVPARVRRAILRGLSTDPAARHPDMNALVSELVARPRWRLPAALGTVALLGAGAVALASSPADPCASADAAASEIWPAERREAVHARFVASGRPHAEHTFEGIDRAFSEHRDAWARSRRDACEATRVHATQSDELFDRRVRCLDRRRAEADALSAALAQADPEAIDQAQQAVAQLPSIEGCDDTDALLAAVPAPEDPAMRERVDALEAKLDAARAQLDLGRYAEARTLAEPLLEAARATEHAPLVADAAHLTAQAIYRAGDLGAAEAPLYEALDAAARGRSIEREAEVWMTLLYVVGYRLGRPDEGLGIERAARGAILRAGGGPRLHARLETNMGLVLHRAGRYDEAKVRAEEGLRTFVQVHGEDHLDVASAAKNLANVLRELGDSEGALAQFRRALAIREAVLGPEHPAVAEALMAVGTVQQDTDPEGALASLERALELQIETLGEHHPRTAETHMAIGNLHFSREDLPRARTAYEQAMAGYEAIGESAREDAIGTSVNLGNILVSLGEVEAGFAMLQRALKEGEEIWGAEHPTVGLVHAKLGHAYFAQGDYERALQSHARATAIREGSLPFDHPDVGESLYNLGALQLLLERHDDARASFDRARDSYAAHYGQDHPEVASVHEQLGALAEALHRPADAKAEYERALAMYRNHLGSDHVLVARVTGNLADALASMGEAEQARATYDEALRLREAAEGTGSPALCYPLLGRAALTLRRAPDDAIADLERCVELREGAADRVPPMELAYARFELAKALVAGRRDRARARELAGRARDEFLTGGEVGAQNVAEIDAWLDAQSHPRSSGAGRP